MPLPGLRAGDATAFSFEYFAPGGVMDVAGDGASRLLAGAGALDLAGYRAWAKY